MKLKLAGRIHHTSILFLFLFCLLFSTFSVREANAQFRSTFASPGAAEQFRLGVQAYQRGRYAESLLMLEKTLAYAPSEQIVKYWLGRAYYKLGFEATALRAWESLSENIDTPPFLKTKIEALRSERSFGSAGMRVASEIDGLRYVEAARFEGKVGSISYFLRPSILLPQPDGSVYVSAHGSNEILRLDQNGIIRERNTGGLRGFDRPFGIASLPDGTLFVTEFNSDRITRVLGNTNLSFGSKGRGDGQLIGPQYATCDAEGYLYVCDYGNARIVKYDPSGEFVLAFGGRNGNFAGFTSPSGVLEINGIVYVADSYLQSIYRFDKSGNYLGVLGEKEFHSPEGLSQWMGDRAILVADTDRVLSFDLATETIDEIYNSPNKKARIVSAVADYNGNLLISDFDESAISVLAEASQIAAGYNVEIERIASDEFPKIILDLSVKDRTGRAVVGLNQSNFHVTERISKSTMQTDQGKPIFKTSESLSPVSDLTFIGAGTTSHDIRAMILAERSSEMIGYREAARTSLSELYSALDLKDKTEIAIGFTSAGKTPNIDIPLSKGETDPTIALKTLMSPTTEVGRFDLGLRLAATGLFPSGSRNAVIYIGTGKIDESSFSETTLSELSSLLQNNEIRFFAIVLGDNPPDSALHYLAEETAGTIYYASRPRGLNDLASKILESPSGRYRFGFTSKADPLFGKAYLSIAAEVYFFKKSGRDELGYFAPLQ